MAPTVLDTTEFSFYVLLLLPRLRFFDGRKAIFCLSLEKIHFLEEWPEP